MKRIKVLTIIIIILSTFSIGTNAQSNDNCKYSIVISFLRTNFDVNKKIKDFFPWSSKKKDKYVDFNVSSRIDFIGINPFKASFKGKKYELDEVLMQDDSLFFKNFFFESYNSTFLERLIDRNNSKLFLTFSKPIGDFLVVELGDFDPFINRKVKYGKTMLMFFKFDETGIIDDVIYSGVAYN